MCELDSAYETCRPWLLEPRLREKAPRTLVLVAKAPTKAAVARQDEALSFAEKHGLACIEAQVTQRKGESEREGAFGHSDPKVKVNMHSTSFGLKAFLS